MSKQRTIDFRCPKCGAQHPFTMWEELNTALDPDKLGQVVDRSLFMFECKDCGEKAVINHDFLLHMPKEEAMIYYACTDESEKVIRDSLMEEDMNALPEMLQKDSYKVRIVQSHNELIEKLFIYNRGLDDRVVELCKVYLLAAYQEENPGAQVVEMYFFPQGENNCIQIIRDGNPAGVINLSEKLYNGVVHDQYKKFSNKINEQLYIDRPWALKLMGTE